MEKTGRLLHYWCSADVSQCSVSHEELQRIHTENVNVDILRSYGTVDECKSNQTSTRPYNCGQTYFASLLALLYINPYHHWNQGADGTLKCLKHSMFSFFGLVGLYFPLKRNPIWWVFLCANLQLEKVNLSAAQTLRAAFNKVRFKWNYVSWGH